jgi:NADPH-dependent 2,4-dienoyl-CoA reductase/sulfur reductase-like enzyme
VSTSALIVLILGSGFILLLLRDYLRNRKLNKVLADMMDRDNQASDEKAEAYINFLTDKKKELSDARKKQAEINRAVIAPIIADPAKSGDSELPEQP